MAERVLASGAEVICLPESSDDLLGPDWHVVRSAPDYGYRIVPGRAKVSLWSRTPWHDVDAIGDAELPPGRFVAATTETSLGVVRVVGVCVPWYAAHVSTGRRDRKPWQDHIAYLQGLRRLPQGLLPTIWLGDLNQTIPSRRAPSEAIALLEDVFSGVTIHTSGVIDGLEQPSVCHIAASPALRALTTFGISAYVDRGQLSDRNGVFVELACSVA